MTIINQAKEQRDRDAAEHCPAEIIELQDRIIKELEAQQADIDRLTLEKKAAAMNFEAEIERLKALVSDTATQYNNALQATQLDLENERRKVTELVKGYEKDAETIKELRAQLITSIGQEFEITNLHTETADLAFLADQYKAERDKARALLRQAYRAQDQLVNQMLQRGVHPDEAHPDRVAVDAAEKSIAAIRAELGEQ